MLSEQEAIAVRSLAERYVAGLFHNCREIVEFFEADRGKETCGEGRKQDNECQERRHAHAADLELYKELEEDSFVAYDPCDDGEFSAFLGVLGSFEESAARLMPQRTPCRAPAAPSSRPRPRPGAPRPRPASAQHVERGAMPWGNPADSESSRLARLMHLRKRGGLRMPRPLSGHGCSQPGLPLRPQRPSSAPTVRRRPHSGQSDDLARQRAASGSSAKVASASPPASGSTASPAKPAKQPQAARLGSKGPRSEGAKTESKQKAFAPKEAAFLRHSGGAHQHGRPDSNTMLLQRMGKVTSRALQGARTYGKTWTRQASADGLEDDERSETCELQAKFVERYKAVTTVSMETSADLAKEDAKMHLLQVAKRAKLTYDELVLAKAAFLAAQDTQQTGSLSKVGFLKAVAFIQQELLGMNPVNNDKLDILCDRTWGSFSCKDTMNLEEFLQWYSMYGFCGDLILSEDTRRVRALSRKYEVSYNEVDKIKRCFDMYDSDGSGFVDEEEFTEILKNALGVPAHLELPPNRVKFFWGQVDGDNSGKVTFEEFLPWWLRYFETKKEAAGAKTPLKPRPAVEYYKSQRNMTTKDPPARKRASELPKAFAARLGSE
eukprot:TRINITY_DN21951_c0_g1_i1.p1 TRINITY_DN21951_c0_g1~~TRINITY_DN21951_c0_g1_i1.p1  ORF type:complete len:624 (+),score=139.92 TRINITY_DN21951_c0_g1_i1:53-1873(+)